MKKFKSKALTFDFRVRSTSIDSSDQLTGAAGAGVRGSTTRIFSR
jgi:hypothetical protein